MATQVTQSLIEKDIDLLYQKARAGEKRGKQAAMGRKIAAYGLKIIAGGGSLAVATGYFSDWHQLIGVAILVAIFLDTITSNHKRLLAQAQAGYAYESLIEKVSRQYNREADPLLKTLRNSSSTVEKAEVEQEIDSLQQRSHKDLTDGIAQIRDSLAKADLKALEALALDNERAAASHA